MLSINLLVDYKNRFETKYTAVPYRSGMDKVLLKQCFADYGFEVKYKRFSDVGFRDTELKNQIFLYTSSEDWDGYYKSFIEDIVLGLKLAGAKILPEYIYLKAHNNKVFMEILRDLSSNKDLKNISSLYFGTLEEVINKDLPGSSFPFVIKPSHGAMSKGVTRADHLNDLINKAQRIARTKFPAQGIRDWLRRIKHGGYLPESKYRKKFLIQNMIMDLTGDYKVLIYGDKYYILKRENREGDFRASGGGRLSYEERPPLGLLRFSKSVYDSFKVPNLSIDVGYNGTEFSLIEFQALYFGTYTLEHSDYYFIPEKEGFHLIHGKSILEKEYARSIAEYIQKGKF